MKQVTLGNVVFSLDDLLKDCKPYLKLIRQHIKPETFVRREHETKDKYLKRLFNNLCRKGFLLEDAETPTEVPTEEANRAPAKEIEVAVYKTESVLKSEVATLTSDIIDKVNSICGVEIYESNSPTMAVLLRYLEDLRAKAISAAHIASLLQ